MFCFSFFILISWGFSVVRVYLCSWWMCLYEKYSIRLFSLMRWCLVDGASCDDNENKQLWRQLPSVSIEVLSYVEAGNRGMAYGPRFSIGAGTHVWIPFVKPLPPEKITIKRTCHKQYKYSLYSHRKFYRTFMCHIFYDDDEHKLIVIIFII